jgi:hypothetical protein
MPFRRDCLRHRLSAGLGLIRTGLSDMTESIRTWRSSQKGVMNSCALLVASNPSCEAELLENCP